MDQRGTRPRKRLHHILQDFPSEVISNTLRFPNVSLTIMRNQRYGDEESATKHQTALSICRGIRNLADVQKNILSHHRMAHILRQSIGTGTTEGAQCELRVTCFLCLIGSCQYLVLFNAHVIITPQFSKLSVTDRPLIIFIHLHKIFNLVVS